MWRQKSCQRYFQSRKSTKFACVISEFGCRRRCAVKKSLFYWGIQPCFCCFATADENGRAEGGKSPQSDAALRGVRCQHRRICYSDRHTAQLGPSRSIGRRVGARWKFTLTQGRRQWRVSLKPQILRFDVCCFIVNSIVDGTFWEFGKDCRNL